MHMWCSDSNTNGELWLLALFERCHGHDTCLQACESCVESCHYRKARGLTCILLCWCSFGSWWTGCYQHGIWHVAISNVGCCSINRESKHITIAMDLASHGIGAVLEACYHFTGFLLPSNLVGIVASPPCTTFSNFDAIRHYHRDHTQPHRPAKSTLAKAHDAMVLNLVTSLWPNIDAS